MALGIIQIPDGNQDIGTSKKTKLFQLVPGVSDYPTGGYLVSPTAVGFYALTGASIKGINALAAGYKADFVFPATSAATQSPTIVGLYLFVSESAGTATTFPQVANDTNLTGVIWIAEFEGY